MADDTPDALEEGFEYQGRFYRWRVTDIGKDLMLIDHFTKMPVQEFFEVVEDAVDRGRAPILLALMATSIRAAHPDRSVERIVRQVMDTNLGEITFIGGDEDEGVAVDMPASGEDGQSPPDGSTDSVTSEPSSVVRSLRQDDPLAAPEKSEQAFESFSATQA